MNRQTKRMMKKQEDAKKAAPRPPVRATGAPAKRERTKPRQFIKEVIAELKKVAWPSRQEIISYSIVVLVASLVIAGIIVVMDSLFSRAVLALFGVES
jgi:preprotein translocase subunit SecE